ncbi:hypothetical protein KDV38_13865 [Providencia rettgeri]
MFSINKYAFTNSMVLWDPTTQCGSYGYIYNTHNIYNQNYYNFLEVLLEMLYIVTFNNYFGQHLKTECSLDILKIKNTLNNKEIETEIIELHDLINNGIEPNSYYWITSHQNQHIKKYLNDIVLSLFINKNENLVTSLELYFAHENKGIQSLLYNNGNDINLVKQDYLIDSEDVKEQSVFKLIDGSGSSGVYLVESKKNIEKIIKNKNLINLSIYNLAKLTKKMIRRLAPGKYNIKAEKYYEKKTPYVLQSFINGLKYDYKVLVFWDHLYVLERKVRENDFRASGSGLFNFIEPDDNLLIFCNDIRKTINSPFVSIDVISLDNGNYHCIEYQATHFGPYTQLNSDFYYQVSDSNDIIRKEKNCTLEDEYAYSIYQFLIKIKKIKCI